MNSSENKLYNLTNLNELCSFDETIVAQLVKTFIASTPILVTDLNNGIINASLQEISDVNHQLKSAFALFQVQEGTKRVGEIEVLIKSVNPNFDQLMEHSNALHLFVAELINSLQETISNH